MVTKIMNWFDDRLPLTATIERHLTKYPAPINMNIWYLAGVLLVVVLINNVFFVNQCHVHPLLFLLSLKLFEQVYHYNLLLVFVFLYH